jgi:transposase
VLGAVAMIDDFERRIAAIDRELNTLGADHRYIRRLVSAPGIAWVLGYTIASEIGDIERFASPAKLVGYQHTKRRLGQQRGAKIAQIDIARRLAEAIRHMLTRDQNFAPAGAPSPLAA